MRAAVVIVVGLVSASARAEPRIAAAEPPGKTPTEAELRANEEPPPAAPTLDRVASYDAGYDRAYLTSGALTLRPGHVEASARSALDHGGIASVAAGIANGFELSVNAAKVGAVGKGLGVAVKVALVRHPTWAVAATASVTGEWHASSDATSKIFAAGARVTACLGGACTALFTFGGGLAIDSNYSTDLNPTIDSSVVIGKGLVRPMMELVVLGGEIGFLGARFGGNHVTFDAGVGKVWGDLTYSLGEDPMAMVGLTLRP